MLEVKSLATITLSGSAQQITTTAIPNVVAVVFHCPAANAGTTVAECNSALAVANGYGIIGGKELSLSASDMHGNTDYFDLTRFYVRGTSSDTVRISYVQRV